MKKKPRKMIKHYNKMKKVIGKCQKNTIFLLYFCKRKFSHFFSTKKQNETTMKTTPILQKSRLNSYRFCRIVRNKK